MSKHTGLKIEEWHDGFTVYEGTQSKLIDTGLFCLSWFPGQPGNGKTSSTFVFTDDTKRNGYIKKPKARHPRENGYGRVCIVSSGNTYRASLLSGRF